MNRQNIKRVITYEGKYAMFTRRRWRTEEWGGELDAGGDGGMEDW